jgi:hypothetical protein
MSTQVKVQLICDINYPKERYDFSTPRNDYNIVIFLYIFVIFRDTFWFDQIIH